jgi:hypothetical protein
MLLLRGFAGTSAELFAYLWHRRLWALIPVVLLLLILGAFIVLGSSSGVGPLMYPVI